MQIEEYKSELKTLTLAFENDKIKLAKKYAFANNNYQLGEIFSDHIGKLQIEEIGITIQDGLPSCIYAGTELKKDGSPMKKQSKRIAYQINEKKIANA